MIQNLLVSELPEEQKQTLTAISKLLVMDKSFGFAPSRSNTSGFMFEYGKFKFLPEELCLVDDLFIKNCENFEGFKTDRLHTVRGSIFITYVPKLQYVPNVIIAQNGGIRMEAPLSESFPHTIYCRGDINMSKFSKIKDVQSTIIKNENVKTYAGYRYNISITSFRRMETLDLKFIVDKPFHMISIIDNPNLKNIVSPLFCKYLKLTQNPKLQVIPKLFELTDTLEIHSCHNLEVLENINVANIVVKNCKGLKTLKNIKCDKLKVWNCPQLHEIDTSTIKADEINIKIKPISSTSIVKISY